MIAELAQFLRNGWPRMKKDAWVMRWQFALAIVWAPFPAYVALWRGLNPGWDEWDGMTIIQFIFFSLMCALIFGHEFSGKTMEFLLSQPVERRTLWREKTCTAAFLVSACLMWDVVLRSTIFAALDRTRWNEGLKFPFVMAVTALTSAPLISLRGRMTLAGVIGTLVIPLGTCCIVLTIILWLILPAEWDYPGRSWYLIRDSLLLIWWAGAYWLGRRTFLRLEV